MACQVPCLRRRRHANPKNAKHLVPCLCVSVPLLVLQDLSTYAEVQGRGLAVQNASKNSGDVWRCDPGVPEDDIKGLPGNC